MLKILKSFVKDETDATATQYGLGVTAKKEGSEKKMKNFWAFFWAFFWVSLINWVISLFLLSGFIEILVERMGEELIFIIRSHVP